MGDDSYNPIYEASEQKGLPILIHSTSGSHIKGSSFEYYRGKGRDLVNHAVGFPFGLIFPLTSTLAEGVAERYPNLKFVFVEGGVTWVTWLRQRLDDEFVKRKYEAPLLRRL